MRRFLDRDAGVGGTSGSGQPERSGHAVKQAWKKGWKRGLAGLLAVVLLTGSLGQSAYAEPAADGVQDPTLSGMLEQLGGELELDKESSVTDGVYGDEKGLASIAGAVYGLPVKISAAMAGAPGTGDSRSASVSADGRYVAFASASANLVEGDTNGKQDIFLQDRETGTVKRISLGAGGAQADGDSYAPYVSFDASYALFASKAKNLVGGDTNGNEDLFLYDARTDTVQRIAQYVPGSEFAGAGSSYQVSADGRYVVYAGKTSSQGTCDIWLLDRRSGTVKLVARQLYIYENFRSRLSISADGRFVAFDSFSREIVPDDVGGNYSYKYRDVYLYDAALNEMKKISRAPDGTTGNHNSYYPAISADGNYVAYLSKANNIVSADTKPSQDVYVYARQTGTTELVSVNGAGAQPGVDAYDPSISADGRYVSFHTDGAYDDADAGRTDVYVRDRIAGTTLWVSKTAGGANADQPADRGTLSADGGTLVFETAATNMGDAADMDAYRDIYAVALNTGAEAPAWPEGAAVSAEPGGSYVALSWPAAPGAAYYKVMQDGRIAGIVTGTSFAADGLGLGSAHRYQVAAGAAGYAWSDWSPEIEARTLAAKETDAPGASAAAVVPVLGGAQVNWSYPGDRDIVGAKVRWRKPGGAVYESALYPKSVVSALVPNLENGEFYDFAVAIVDGDGNVGAGEWTRARMPAGPAIVRMDVLRGTGGPAGSQNGRVAAMNGDGRYTLFTSDMHFLVPEDDRTAPYNSYTSATQLYLYDAELGSVRLISRTWDGKLGNGNSSGASISADGRYIVFGSAASNLLQDAPDTNGKWDVFLADRDVNGNGTFDEPGDTSLSKISTPYVNGGQANGDSSGPLISADGSTIIFNTNAKNLVDEPPAGTSYYNIVMSTEAREPEALVLPNGKSPGVSGMSMDLSADGKTIAFNTYTSFDEEDTDSSSSDIYWYDWHDPDDKKLVWLSGMIQDRKYAGSVFLDGSGKIAVFDITLQNNQYETYVFDAGAPAGTIPGRLIDVPDGSGMTLDYLTASDITDDGRHVLFESSGKNIVPGLSGNFTRVYLWDRIGKKATLVSQPYDPALTASSSASYSFLSGDGTRSAYMSTMMNMVRGSERAEYSYGLYLQRIAAAAPDASWPAGSALTASDIGKNSVKLTWTAAANATGGYRVEGGPAPVEVPAGTLETVVTGLSPATDYTFKVQASAAGGAWTTAGPTAAVRTLADTGLADLTVTLQDGEVRLSWSEPPAGADIAAFRVARKTEGGEWTTLATVSDPAARGYADRTALPGRTYAYAVRSLDAQGAESPYSVEKSIAVGGTGIASFTYAMPFYNRQHAGQEDAIALKMAAPSGAEANATLSYTDKDGIARTADTELLETARAGIYEGTLIIPKFAASLDSLKGTMAYESETYEKEALQKPIAVGGTVLVTLDTGTEVAFDSLLTLYSKKAAAYRTVTLNGALAASFKGLPAADDYKLTLIGAGGIDLLEESQVAPIAVETGGNHDASAMPQLPAQLSLAVSYPTGSASGVMVLVTDASGAPLASGVTPGNGSLTFPAFKGMIGKTVTIRAVPGNALYAPLEQTLTLVSGRNRVELAPALKTDATLTGQVSDMEGKPVRDATVQVTLSGSYYRAQTNDAGKYTLRAPAGEVYVQALAAGSFSSGWIKTELAAGQTQTLNIEYKRRIPAIVRVNLYTEAENGTWIGPYDLDWREMVHYRVYARGGMVSGGNPMLVEAEAGQSVTICADGAEAGYTSVCVPTAIGNDLKGEVVIRLENKISKATGKLSDVPATLTVYRIDGANRSYVKGEGAPQDGRFTLNLPGAGSYELRVSAGGGRSLIRTFTVADHDAIDLGELKPAQGGAFAGQIGNAVLLGTSRPGPGTALQVRAAYANASTAQVGGAVLVLDVPAETALVPDSVVWNGKPVTPSLDNGRYLLPLGAIAAKGTGTVQYQLRIADEPQARELDVSPRIRYSAGGVQQEEELGTARASLSQVTISAPGRTAFRSFIATGSAPGGSRVIVEAGDKIVGTADAAPNGRWTAAVEMPGEGKTADWQLRASATLGGKTWRSDAAGVSFDEGIAEPIEFTMKQSDGRTIRLDPRGGEQRFPYVFAPGLPFILTLKFNHPELARDVAFYIGETRVPASLKDGVFTAVLSGIQDPGAIGVDYGTRESPASMDETVPTPTEIKDRLPPAFRDAVKEDLVVSPRTNGDARQSLSYKGKLPASIGSAKLTLNASLERTTYAPNANDLRIEQETGVPAYGVKLTESFSGGVLRLEMTGYLPEDQFSAGLDAGKAMALLSAGAENQAYADLISGLGGKGKKTAEVKALNGAVRVVAARVAMAFESTAGENTWKTIDAAYSIYDGRGSGDTLADLEYLMDKVSRYCDPYLVPAYMDHINFLKNHLIAVELTKAAIMVAGAVAGPATFGLGTIALFLVSNAAGKVLDGQLAGMVADLNRDIDSNPYCKIPKKPKKPIADPEWIYDPSGYAYEVTEDRRIEGVKATVLRRNEDTNRWDVWDAGWYGQDNPLYTDAEGRYAWDVPKGKWKVLFEKEGYLPAESEELTVLPPHFDVNVAMISTLPAKPVRVEAAPGGASVDVLFDRHVKGDAIGSDLLKVIDAGNGSEVAGTWTSVEPTEDGAARRVRFAPEQTLEEGRAYTVRIDAALQSYAGIPLGEAYETDVVVTAADTTPPAAVTSLAAEADGDQALVTWKNASDPDTTKIVVAYKMLGAGSEQSVEVPAGQQYALLAGLGANASYSIEVRAYDAAGNYSIAKTSAGTAAAQPESLDIAPPGPAVIGTVTPDADAVNLTWQDPADGDLSGIGLQWAAEGQELTMAPVAVAKGVGKYAIAGLAPATSYEIRVWTVDYAGNESPAQTLFVTTKAAGGGTGGGPGNPGGGGQTQDPDAESGDIGAEGGSLSFFGGKLKLRLPGSGGAAGAAKKVTAAKVSGSPAPADAHLKPVSDVYDWKLETGAKLAGPGKLTIAYDAAKLAGADPRKLGLYRQHASDKTKWTYAGGIVDGASGSVETEVTEPGVYAVLIAEYSYVDLASHWSRVDVEVLAARGIVSGDPAGTFRPNGSVTRAEFVKLVLPLLSGGAGTGIAAERFADVPADAWYAEAVAAATAAGIVKGADGKFRPSDPITREEMAVMLYRALGIVTDDLDPDKLLGDLRDGADVSGWARMQVAYAVQSGLLKGSGGKLNPGATATRGESATVVLRALDALGRIAKKS
ncbi:fibronectin type III domain-containing protein [Cohnella sp. JJ-181]|uniref:fibronectin type III domain-containing protein n=1 Tax=Cohnella rhizoplanae TaxID=2974897 RepID=UPI0022FF5EAA|nr:fibronectin type III domain-containing protein [Cohnella sp. JJ-181]CAI6083649.1 hypothetical protein COHCIP112018_04071 [Cohnella sp. JJ-181]